MPNIIHADYETFSKADLTKVGGWRYAADPSTEILMIGLALNDEEPVVWLPNRPQTVEQQRAERNLDLISDPTTLVYAWNATGFEIPITDYLFEHTTGFKAPKHHQWRCVQAMARKGSFPQSLEKCAEGLGMEQKKDTRGKALIRKFCIPQKADKRQLAKGITVPERILPADDSAAFAEFVEYCRQDVVVERDLCHMLAGFELGGNSLQTFQFDIELNARGLPVNVAGLHRAQAMIDEVTTRVAAEFRAITGFEHTQGKVFLPWLKDHGYTGKNLTADTIEEVLESAEADDILGSLHGDAAAALKLKQQIGYASLKKVKAMRDCVGPHDNRVRGCHVYHGATTGRWTAKLVQQQNFKRPTIGNTEQAYADICEGCSAEFIELFYGAPLEVLSSCIRHFIHDTQCRICADRGVCGSPPDQYYDCQDCPPLGGGYDLLDADYSAIEGRIVCWL